MISNDVSKEYIFNLLLANGFEVKEVIDFGKTDKENQYSLACTTDEEDNDLICLFEIKEGNGKIKISNINVC